MSFLYARCFLSLDQIRGAKTIISNYLCFFVILWGLWNVRNKTWIEKKFLQSSYKIFHKICLLIQKWHILLKDQNVRFLDDKVDKMKFWLQGF